MIKATKENNKIRVSLEGDTHDLIAEFFSIVNHVAEAVPKIEEEQNE